MPSKKPYASARTTRQTRLTFDPIDATSKPKGPSPAKVRYEKPSGSGLASVRPTRSSGQIAESDSDDDDILFSSSIASRPRSAKAKRDGKLPFQPVASTPTRPSQQSSSRLRLSDDSSDLEIGLGEHNIAMPFTGSGRKHQRKRRVEVDVDSSDGSAPEAYETPSKKRGNHKGKAPVRDSTSEDDLVRDRAQIEISSDSDSDAIISTQNVRRSRQNAVTVEDDGSESEDLRPSPLKRNRLVSDDDESDIAPSPLKRRRESRRTTRGNIVEVKETSESEDNGKTNITRTTRQSKIRKHRTEKEKKLELLKRRRAGENIEELTETSESDPNEDDQSEFEKLSEFEDDEDDDSLVVEKPQPIARKRRGSREDDDDLGSVEDFIADDDELGVPDPSILDIPLEFTHAAHKPLKEHFRDAVEWMVHNKINPAFARNDPVYRQAFMKLDNEYGGYAKSKFVSTQWTAEFTRAIYARPEFLVRDLAVGEEMTIAGEVICQVCNHRKYIPKYEIQFGGKPYNIDTLDELEQESDDEDEDDALSAEGSEGTMYNADGQEIPPISQTWLSGQYCKRNAEQAHSLIHWKYALNQWVLDTLDFEGYLAPEKLAEREKMKSKQRRKCANDIVDIWESHNQIKDLYRDFKINLETARETTNGPWQNGRYRR